MSDIHSTDLSTDLETLIQNKITEEKANRKEVSNGHYAAIALSMLVIVGCLAFQNALYGYSQGSTYTAMVLLGVMYFAGDWALAALTSLETRKSSVRVLTCIAKTGLVLLSLTAGVSFMLSEQHANDVKTSRVASLEADIQANQQAFQQYHKTITAQRLTGLRRELEEERARVGADHASSNAVYMYVGKMTGYSFEAVSFLVRALWIVVFIVTGMTLSTLLGVLWCPWKEDRAHAQALKGQRAALRRQKAYLALHHQQRAIEEKKAPLRKATTPQGTRAPTQDTGTTGAVSHRYQKVRGLVMSRHVRPSVSALRKLGMGTATAQGYLRRLAEEGVIKRAGQGYQPTNMQ